MMKSDRYQWLVFGLLVGVGAAVRLGLQEIPNFAPVAAIALFAGYAFRSRLLALAAPLSVMAISDWFIGGYDLTIMAVVYGMLTLPVFARGFLQRHCKLQDQTVGGAVRSLFALCVSAIGSSVCFFLLTNMAVYLRWYERTWENLAQCYLMALPFFRFTLAGDAVFALVLFSAYALILNLGYGRERDAAISLEG